MLSALAEANGSNINVTHASGVFAYINCQGNQELSNRDLDEFTVN